MPELSAINFFPEEWTNKVRCPICRSRYVEIQRFDAQPDQIHCPNCGVSFQIETKGNHIKFLETPINFYEGMKNRWVTRNEVEEAVKNNRIRNQNSKLQDSVIKPINAKPNQARAEAVRRARSLVQLKNNEVAIRAALMSSSNLSAAEIEEIIKDAFSVYETQQKQQTKRVLIYSLVFIVLLIVFFVVMNALF